MKTIAVVAAFLCVVPAAAQQTDLGGAIASGLSLGAKFRDDHARFAPVWDAKKRRLVCRNASGEEGRNKMTAEELLATKNGACARIWAGTDLMMKDLAGADLRLADLTAAWLQETHLEGADLRGANLWAANLDGAYLTGARFGRGTVFPSTMDSEAAERRGMVRDD